MIQEMVVRTQARDRRGSQNGAAGVRLWQWSPLDDAVPGPIDKPTSAGCNQLIRDGATLVADASHILDDLGELPFARKASAAEPAAEPASIGCATPSTPTPSTWTCPRA